MTVQEILVGSKPHFFYLAKMYDIESDEIILKSRGAKNSKLLDIIAMYKRVSKKVLDISMDIKTVQIAERNITDIEVRVREIV